MAGIEQRIVALEASFAPASPSGDGGGEAQRLRRKFVHGSLDALAHIKRASIDSPPWGYDVEKLRKESPFIVATYVAALTVLEHEDGDEARAILAKLEEEGDIDPAPFEHLIKVVVAIDSQAKRHPRRDSQSLHPRRRF